MRLTTAPTLPTRYHRPPNSTCDTNTSATCEQVGRVYGFSIANTTASTASAASTAARGVTAAMNASLLFTVSGDENLSLLGKFGGCPFEPVPGRLLLVTCARPL